MSVADPVLDLPPRSPRIATVEFLRIFGCVGVCMFHAGAPWPRHLLPGSEMFIVLTVAFASRAVSKHGFVGLVKSRFLSLVVTWLIWCGIYGAYRTWTAARHGAPLLSWITSPHMLAAGTINQLWFLPFAFLVTIAACLWAMATRRAGVGRGFLPVAIASGVLMLLCAAAHTHWQDVLGNPYQQWLRMLPGAAIGVAMGQIPQGTRAALAPAATVWAIAVASAILATLLGWPDIPSRYFATCTFVGLAWCIPVLAPRWLLYVSQLTFGVYVSHMAMLYLNAFIATKLHLSSNVWVEGAAAMVAAFCFVPILRYTRLRWMVGIWATPGPGHERPTRARVRPSRPVHPHGHLAPPLPH